MNTGEEWMSVNNKVMHRSNVYCFILVLLAYNVSRVMAYIRLSLLASLFFSVSSSLF